MAGAEACQQEHISHVAFSEGRRPRTSEQTHAFLSSCPSGPCGVPSAVVPAWDARLPRARGQPQARGLLRGARACPSCSWLPGPPEQARPTQQRGGGGLRTARRWALGGMREDRKQGAELWPDTVSTSAGGRLHVEDEALELVTPCTAEPQLPDSVAVTGHFPGSPPNRSTMPRPC